VAILTAAVTGGWGLLADEPASQAFKPIPRSLPPEGIELPADVQEKLRQSVETVQRRLAARRPCGRLMIQVPATWQFSARPSISPCGTGSSTREGRGEAASLLAEANKRLDELENMPAGAKRSWEKATGLVVRGYTSWIDDSPQPYGLVIPDDYDGSKQVPLYVWLHGRGDKNTDLHFIHERMTRQGQIAPPGAIVLHPFGRHCVGFKFAGEIDVLDAVRNVRRNYHIDPQRIVLIGFSMGGAGAWHIGAHYADKFCAISPGAGFAETAHYRKLKAADYPPEYEQKLWGLYDVPCYTRNLFNTPVIAYSGELDKQIQAARVMEEAFAKEGRTLTHLIGPKTEHKYEPETLKELLRRIDEHVRAGNQIDADEIHLQTRTLRYANQRWIRLLGLEQHWVDARVDAKRDVDGNWEVTTAKVTAIELDTDQGRRGKRLTIDGQQLEIEASAPRLILVRERGRWRREVSFESAVSERKFPNRSGPIDDAFMNRFLVVMPTGKSQSPVFQRWVEFESQHFLNRWRALMRGDARVKKDIEVTWQDLTEVAEEQNLILWGDAASNRIIARLGEAALSGLRRPRDVRRQKYDAANLPSVGAAIRTLSQLSLTFREHTIAPTPIKSQFRLGDHRFSQPRMRRPRKIHAAGFFDEQWRLPAK
jgi:predicted esterase